MSRFQGNICIFKVYSYDWNLNIYSLMFNIETGKWSHTRAYGLFLIKQIMIVLVISFVCSVIAIKMQILMEKLVI